MGSGQGKTRRARAAADVRRHDEGEPYRTPGDCLAWTEFVREQRLEAVTVGDYYDADGGPSITSNYGFVLVSKQRTLVVIAELFRDLINMGAITLPAGVSADDFSFQTQAFGYNPEYKGDEAEWLFLKMRGKNSVEKCFLYPRVVLDNHTKIGSKEISSAAQGIVEATHRITQ